MYPIHAFLRESVRYEASSKRAHRLTKHHKHSNKNIPDLLMCIAYEDSKRDAWVEMTARQSITRHIGDEHGEGHAQEVILKASEHVGEGNDS